MRFESDICLLCFVISWSVTPRCDRCPLVCREGDETWTAALFSPVLRFIGADGVCVCLSVVFLCAAPVSYACVVVRLVLRPIDLVLNRLSVCCLQARCVLAAIWPRCHFRTACPRWCWCNSCLFTVTSRRRTQQVLVRQPQPLHPQPVVEVRVPACILVCVFLPVTVCVFEGTVFALMIICMSLCICIDVPVNS